MADGVRYDPASLAELERFGKALKGADTILRKNLRSELGRLERPLADAVISEGAAGLPNRGGLRARARGARGAVKVETLGGSIRLTFAFTDRQRDSLQGFEDGVIHHPVFGVWRKGTPTQRVTPHRFSRAFLRRSSLAQARTHAALDQTAVELARKA